MSSIARLETLAKTLHTVYQDVGLTVERNLSAVNAAVQQIGVVYQPKHWAEKVLTSFILKKDDPFFEDIKSNTGAWLSKTNLKHPHYFYHEKTNDHINEFGLCAIRNREANKDVSLYVSICEFKLFEAQADPDVFNYIVQLYGVRYVRPQDLSLQIRVKILDVLDDFCDEYSEYVEKEKEDLLAGTALKTYFHKPSSTEYTITTEGLTVSLPSNNTK